MRNGHYCRQATPLSAYGSGDEADRIGDGPPVSNVAPFSVYAWLRSSPTAEACDIAGQRGARIHAIDIGRDTQPHGRAAIALLEKCADRGYGGNPAVDEVHAMRSARKLKDAVEDIIPIRRTLRFVDCSPDALRNATSTTEHRLASIEVPMAAALSELEVLLMPDDKAAYENRRATRQSGFPEGISTNCDRTRVAAGCTGQRRSASRKTRQWNATARGDQRRRAGSRREASKYGSDSHPANEMKHGRSPTRWLKVFRGRVAWPGVRIASRASGRAWRLGKGTAWVLALLAGIGHAEERSHESGASGVFYVSATVVSDDTGGLGESGAAVAFANVDCGWEDAPPGATVGCVSPVAEGARLRIAVRHINAEGEPDAAETDLEFLYRTTPISATADADYLSASGTLTIKAGEFVSSPATLTTLDDVLDEFQELFAVELESDHEFPVDLEFDYVVIPINDNDPEVRVSLDGEDAAEDAGILSFEVSLSGTSGKKVTVDFATSDGTAVADADYRPAAGTLTFEPGEIARTVEVSVIDDAVQEPAEWFALALANARNARLPRAPARGTIRDDDALLTIAGASAGEASGGLEFVVTATGLAAGDAPVTVDYATQDGTATAGADYEPVSGSLTFTAERAEQVVAVPLIDDAVDEPEETLTVVLTNVANATIGTAAAVGVIEDDDPAPELEISAGAASEGETMEFAVTLSGSTARTVTVDFATSDGTAVAEADYRPAAGTLTFEPGEIARTVEVSVIDDAIHEPAEWFELALTNARNARLPRAPARGTIRDDDAFLTIAGASAGEASDRLEFVVTATGLAAGDAPVTVDYATQDGTATAGADYEPVSGSLTFTAERAEQVVAVPLIDDAVDEPEETLTVVLTNVANATIGTAAAVGVIEDDDPAPELEISGGAASEGETMEFAVTLSGSTARTVTVDFATSDGTAVAEADYRPAAGTLTFEPGEIARTVEVSVVDDAVHEPAEWFELALSNARNARLPRFPARGTIQDDDAFLTIAGASAGEASDRLEFVVTATGLAAGDAPVTVDYATQDGTATAGADYEPVSGTLTFTAERAEQVVAVPLIDDAVDEPEETLTVVLTNVANATIGTAAAVGVIEDDDPAPELEISGGAASEGETMEFAVTLSGSTARTVTVDYATADGSATAGADYGSVSGTLTFAPGESSATVSVDIVDDEMYEPDETFVARLSSPINAVIAAGEATGTILDDDEEPAAVAVLPENPMLCVGGAPARIDLSRHFSGTALSYTVSAPDPSVATASLGGAVLVLTPVAEGETSVSLTAANMGSRATLELTITVVADPAELAAIERGLAVAGGVFLADVMDAIGDRFVDAGASDRGSNAPPPASALVDRSAADVFAAEWVANPGGFAAREAPEQWPPARPLDNMRLGSGSLSFSATPRSGIGNWSVWGRGGTRRFGDGEMLQDGSLTALQVGADARVGDWLIGAAGVLGRTEAEYGFMRSADACGGGEGEGVLETEMASVHPYLGRRVGRGWIWGTAGVGGGEAVVERCASGHRTAADLSMRMGALGGRHVIRGSQRVEVSLVEDVGVLRAKTEAAIGPAGNHDVSVGRARLGVEVRGVCATGAGIVGWVRAFARRDWGDGIEGSGAEVALGARLDAPERRVRLEAGVHAVAAHTEADYEERGANLAAAYLSRPDGTGLQVSMALRRGAPGEASRLGESWRLSSGPRDARRGMRGDVSVGFGFRAPRGLARPFAAVGKSDQGRIVAAGLRYEALPGPSQFVGEFSIGHRRGGGFVMARFEARR